MQSSVIIPNKCGLYPLGNLTQQVMTTMEGLGDRDHKYLKKESKLDPCSDGRNNKVNDESSN